MAILNSNGVHYDFNVTDGIHVQNIVIQNSTSTGKIVDNDNWNGVHEKANHAFVFITWGFFI